MSEQIIAAIIGSLGGIIIAGMGILGARRLGIGDNQEKLINTLKDLIDINEKQIEELKSQLAQAKAKIAELEAKVASLEDVTVNQALEISGLNKAASTFTTARRRSHEDGGGQ